MICVGSFVVLLDTTDTFCFISMYVCVVVLLATMICVGSFFVFFDKQITQVFVFPRMCVLWCSVAAVCHHDLLWLLLCFIRFGGLQKVMLKTG